MVSFGEALSEARKKRGISQEELGIAVGIDKRIISRYENDKTVPSVDVAKKMADALETSLDKLTGLKHSLFIEDKEMTKLLKDYGKLNESDKSIIKRFLKAFSFYSKLEESQLAK